MKNYPLVILFIIIIFSVGITCHIKTEPDDQILYQEIDPDTSMVYDIEVLYEYPYEFRGDFSYLIDLDQDSLYDFEVSGSTWPGHFDHVGVIWYNDHETKILALHEKAFIGGGDSYGPCCETGLVIGDVINDQFEWAEEVRLAYEIMDNMIDCSWQGDYIALKLIKEGHRIFGWIAIDGSQMPTIKDMAVNLTYDKKIRAGQKE